MRPRSRRAIPSAPRPPAACLALLFEREELPLALQSPGVPAQAAVGANGAVAGHGKRHRVGAAGAADRTHCRRRADGAGDLLIRAGLAARNAPQLVPHSALEYRAADIERQPREARLAFDEGEDPGFQLFQVARENFGGAELLREEALEALGVVAQLDRAKALVGRRDQHAAQRRRERAVADALALAPGAVVPRFHAEHGLFVEA